MARIVIPADFLDRFVSALAEPSTISCVGTAALACRIFLAAIFATAAAGKLMDLEGSRRSLQAFNVQGDVARLAGTALPIAELATAVLLIISPTAQVGAAFALVLLLIFIAGIVRALRQGRTPDCNCFGALHSAPAGRNTVGRNVALAVIAIFALVEGPGPGVDSWVANHSGAAAAAVVLSILSVVLAVSGFWTWRQNRRLTEQIEATHEIVHGIPPGLPIGALAPNFDVASIGGGRLTLDGLLDAGKPALLVFSFPGCGVCHKLMPDLDHWTPVLANRLTVGQVGWDLFQRAENFHDTGTPGEPFPRELDAEMHELLSVLEAYRLKGTPSAVIVAPDGMIASSTVDGRPAIEALIRTTLARESTRPAVHSLVSR